MRKSRLILSLISLAFASSCSGHDEISVPGELEGDKYVVEKLAINPKTTIAGINLLPASEATLREHLRNGAYEQYVDLKLASQNWVRGDMVHVTYKVALVDAITGKKSYTGSDTTDKDGRTYDIICISRNVSDKQLLENAIASIGITGTFSYPPVHHPSNKDNHLVTKICEAAFQQKPALAASSSPLHQEIKRLKCIQGGMQPTDPTALHINTKTGEAYRYDKRSNTLLKYDDPSLSIKSRLTNANEWIFTAVRPNGMTYTTKVNLDRMEGIYTEPSETEGEATSMPIECEWRPAISTKMQD